MKAASRLFAMTNTTPKSMPAILFMLEGLACYAHYTGFTPVIQQSICHVIYFFVVAWFPTITV
jgi:hypothetical protein